MAGAMTAFTVNDAFLKALSDELPLFQALTLRGIGLIACLFALSAALGQLRFDLGSQNWKLILTRSGAEVLAAYFFLTALFNMPIANVTAILQSLPLTVTLAGALFLGEALGWRRMLAILIGFAGVLLIVQPGGAGFNSYALYVLAAVACVTVRDLVVRRMSSEVPSIMVALVAAIAVTSAAALASLFIDWVPVSPKAGLQLAASTLFIVGGYICSVTAMRHGELSFVAPFRYTALLVALILGWAVFDEFPGALTLTGAAIVVATGLFTLWREAKLARKRSIGRPV